MRHRHELVHYWSRSVSYRKCPSGPTDLYSGHCRVAATNACSETRVDAAAVAAAAAAGGISRRLWHQSLSLSLSLSLGALRDPGPSRSALYSPLMAGLIDGDVIALSRTLPTPESLLRQLRGKTKHELNQCHPTRFVFHCVQRYQMIL